MYFLFFQSSAKYSLQCFSRFFLKKLSKYFYILLRIFHNRPNPSTPSPTSPNPKPEHQKPNPLLINPPSLPETLIIHLIHFLNLIFQHFIFLHHCLSSIDFQNVAKILMISNLNFKGIFLPQPDVGWIGFYTVHPIFQLLSGYKKNYIPEIIERYLLVKIHIIKSRVNTICNQFQITCFEIYFPSLHCFCLYLR